MLDARNMSVTLDGHEVLSDAGISVAPGEFVGLIGPNGAGKSTLLRSLVGLQSHSGAVTLDGSSFASLTPRERARRLAYLPQDRVIEWPMKVREIVALGRHPFRQGFARLNSADREAIGNALAAVDALAFAERSALTLSAGEKALVLLARALAVEAPVLLADEPVAALDPFHQLHVMEILRARAHSGTGVLAVLHEMTLASRFLDRVVLMDQGRIVCEGPPADVLTSEILERVYKVTPLIGEHRGSRWLVPWERTDPARSGTA